MVYSSFLSFVLVCLLIVVSSHIILEGSNSRLTDDPKEIQYDLPKYSKSTYSNQQIGDTISFTLPGNSKLVGTIEFVKLYEGGAMYVSGTTTDGGAFSVSYSNNAISANIEYLDNIQFELRPLKRNIDRPSNPSDDDVVSYTMMRVNTTETYASLEKDDEDKHNNVHQHFQVANKKSSSFMISSSSSSPHNAIATQAIASPLKMLVFYTREAVNAIGSESALLSTIALAVGNFDLTLRNSQIDVAVSYVAERMPNYDSYVESDSMSVMLNQMQAGGIDMSRRYAVGAHAVQLVTKNNVYCGLGQYNYDGITNGLSVTNYGCIGGYLSLAHEVAHNIGLQHDISTYTTAGMNHGYCWDSGTSSCKRSVMSMAACVTSTGRTNCARVPYFSNPSVYESGNPTGNSISYNNAQMFKNNINNFELRQNVGTVTIVNAGTPIAPAPTAAPLNTATSTTTTATDLTNLGCWADANPRSMPQYYGTGYTVKTCATAARNGGFAYFGLQYYGECRASNDLNAVKVYGTSTKCTTPCNADSSVICGGPNANSVYSIGSSSTTAAAAPIPAPTIAPVRAPTSTPINPPTPSPITTAVTTATGVSSLGCWTDSNPRSMPQYYGTGYTIITCANAAKNGGFAYFGLQYYGECRASNDLNAVKVYGTSTQCTTPCNADSSVICGGPNANSVYSIGSSSTTTIAVASTPVPTVKPVSPPTPVPIAATKYSSMGCWIDGNPRAMPNTFPGNTFTVDTCMAIAAQYKYFALQYGGECWASNNLADVQRYGVSTQCTMTCRAAPGSTCGGGNANQVYVNNAILLHSASHQYYSSFTALVININQEMNSIILETFASPLLSWAIVSACVLLFLFIFYFLSTSSSNKDTLKVVASSSIVQDEVSQSVAAFLAQDDLEMSCKDMSIRNNSDNYINRSNNNKSIHSNIMTV